MPLMSSSTSRRLLPKFCAGEIEIAVFGQGVIACLEREMGGCGTARGQAQFSGKGFIGIEVEGVFQVVILLRFHRRG